MKKGRTPAPWQVYATAILSFLLLTGLDQFTKYLAVEHLKDRPSVVLIPGILELSYLENSGMAWGMFAGKRALFLILTAVFFLIVLYVFIRLPKTAYYAPFGAVLVLLASGGAGNFIDRIKSGTVKDFIYISLIHFPVFNVADILVVCGGILLFLLFCLKYKDDDFAFLSLKRNS